MKCPNCERAELIESLENYHYQECGLNNVTLVEIKVRKCPECGNVMPRIPNIEGLHDAIAHDLIKGEERLAAPEIVFLRKYLGWSCGDFAKNMHTDRPQISKWEHGKVPMSKPYELLLRGMVAYGKKIEDYASHEAAKKKTYRARPLMFKHQREEWKKAA